MNILQSTWKHLYDHQTKGYLFKKASKPFNSEVLANPETQGPWILIQSGKFP